MSILKTLHFHREKKNPRKNGLDLKNPHPLNMNRRWSELLSRRNMCEAQPVGRLVYIILCTDGNKTASKDEMKC